MIIQENGFEFEACCVGRNVIVTLRNRHGDEVNATFSIGKADDCEAAIAAAIDEINGAE